LRKFQNHTPAWSTVDGAFAGRTSLRAAMAISLSRLRA
jgi:hypothetical protein